jgi:hypothetical protein
MEMDHQAWDLGEEYAKREATNLLKEMQRVRN